MTGLGRHGERAAALDREIVLGKDGGVYGVVVRLNVFAGRGKRVFAPRNERENDLFGVDHIKRGAVFAGNGNAVERENDLFLRRVHDDLPVGERSRHAVAAAGGDRDGVSDNEYAAALGARRAVRELDRAGRLYVRFRLRLGGEKRGFGLRFGPVRIGSAVVCRRGAAAADKRNAQRETKQRG